jgi:hypothetical protein
MNERRATYHPDNKMLRVISVANGLWQAQERSSDEPGNNRANGKDHFDPWSNLHAPSDLDSAMAVMNERSYRRQA